MYKETHGNCLVPYNYETNPKLATWVSTQRTQYRLLKNGQISSVTSSRIEALESIGFIWNLQSTSHSLIVASPTVVDNADAWSEVKLLHQRSLFWDSNLHLEGNDSVLVDVCEATLTTKKGQPCFFFSKSRFSSCTEETLKAIHKELFLAARRSGFTISKKQSFHEDVRTGWKFICSYGRCHQTTKENQLINDKETTKKRQSRTTCPVDPLQRCGWSITIRYNHFRVRPWSTWAFGQHNFGSSRTIYPEKGFSIGFFRFFLLGRRFRFYLTISSNSSRGNFQ